MREELGVLSKTVHSKAIQVPSPGNQLSGRIPGRMAPRGNTLDVCQGILKDIRSGKLSIKIIAFLCLVRIQAVCTAICQAVCTDLYFSFYRNQRSRWCYIKHYVRVWCLSKSIQDDVAGDLVRNQILRCVSWWFHVSCQATHGCCQTKSLYLPRLGFSGI